MEAKAGPPNSHFPFARRCFCFGRLLCCSCGTVVLVVVVWVMMAAWDQVPLRALFCHRISNNIRFIMTRMNVFALGVGAWWQCEGLVLVWKLYGNYSKSPNNNSACVCCAGFLDWKFVFSSSNSLYFEIRRIPCFLSIIYSDICTLWIALFLVSRKYWKQSPTIVGITKMDSWEIQIEEE